MAGKILLGIDFGTTVLKVCAFDARSGAILVHAARRLTVHSFTDGGREQRLESVDRSFRNIVKELKERLGAAWRKVEGIGLATQGGSTIIADRMTGKPHTPMILWNDGRTHAYTTRVAKKVSVNYWRKYVLRDVPPAGLGRLLWLKETRPGLFTKETIHIGAGEYLFFKLTSLWRQDAGNAIQIGSYNAATRQLDPTLFNRIDFHLSLVAPLRQGHEIAPLSRSGARLLDLPEGIPVAGPYIDQEAGYLSASAVSHRPLQCSLGTAWVANFVLPDDTIASSPLQLVLPSPVGDGRLVVQPLLTGNVAWEWGLDTLMATNRDRALLKANEVFAESLLPRKGLIALPWFTQPNPICTQAYGGGAFFGLSAQTDRADQLRALAAGITFELARVFAEIRQSDLIDSVVIGGGASKGVFFRRLIAALFSPLPVLWQVDEDLSVARGAVFAFNPKVARTKTKRIPPPKKALLTQIQDGYDLYLAVFDEFYKSMPGAKAFQLCRGE
ncbi:MAG: FGGY-family carbohydrate kinase [bacterium]